jgi:hypothetical protein
LAGRLPERMVSACLESRASVGRMLCHALNRGNLREVVFHKPGDYDAFVEAMIDVCVRVPLDLLDIKALCPRFSIPNPPASPIVWRYNPHEEGTPMTSLHKF